MMNSRKVFNSIASGIVGFVSYPLAFAYHATQFFRNGVMDDEKPWWLRFLLGGVTFATGVLVATMAVAGLGWFMMPATAYYAGSYGYNSGFVAGCEAPFSPTFDRFFGSILHCIWDFFDNGIKFIKNNCCPKNEPVTVTQMTQEPSKPSIAEQKSEEIVPYFSGQRADLPPGQSFLYPPRKQMPVQALPNQQPPVNQVISQPRYW